MSMEELYADILRVLFNAPMIGALRVNWLKRTDGELALHVGENPPFGVVNIGDPKNLFEQCRREQFTTPANRSFLIRCLPLSMHRKVRSMSDRGKEI